MALQAIYAAGMTRRGWGDDGIYWVASRKRYAGAISLGWSPTGKRLRKIVYGETKQAVKDKLKELHEDLAQSVQTSRDYTLLRAVNDWLDEGMDNPSQQTIAKYRTVLRPLLAELGSRPLSDVTAREVRSALVRYAPTHATETVGIARSGLERAVRFAEANGHVRKNVVELVTTPKGHYWATEQGPDDGAGKRRPRSVGHTSRQSGVSWPAASPADSYARLHHAVAARRHSDRGGARTAMGSSRPCRESRSKPARPTERRGLALGACAR
jgi:hypothetical protein